MSERQGKDGSLYVGGVLVGSPLVQGALTQGTTTMTIDDTTLTGLVVVGDTFTIAGETGSPEHTVTGGPFYVATGDEITAITFTPSIATGGTADNAAVSFVTNSAAQIVDWTLNDVGFTEVNTTVKGDLATEYVGGIMSFGGRATANLDYGDAIQKELLDKMAGPTPGGAVISGLVLTLSSGKNIYAGALLSKFSITSQEPESTTPVMVDFDFKGTGVLGIDWNV